MTITQLPTRLLLLLLVLFAAASSLFAQQGDEWDFSNVPVDDQTLPYIGVGGGYIGTVAFLNYDELNTVSRGLGLGDFSGPMWLHGGGGFTAVYVLPNIRLGVFGLGGSKEISGNVTLNGVALKRTLRFEMGMTAVQFDYAIPLVGALTVFPGFLVGLNSYDLHAMQYQAETVAFNGLFGADGFSGTGAENRATQISSGAVFLNPAVNLEYALTQFFLLRLGGGYGINFRYGDWKTANDVTVSGVPNIKAQGAMVQFGVFIGLFQ